MHSSKSASRSRILFTAVLSAVGLWTSVAAAPRAHAQGDVVWQLEDVAPLHPIPGCVFGMTVAGFDHDPQGRPVVAWREENECGATPRVFWTRKESGSWIAREFLSEHRYAGGAKGDFSHTLILRPSDGNPFLVFRDVGDNNSLLTYRTDLGAYPSGGVSDSLEFLVGERQCGNANYSLAFAPGAEVPDWSTGLVNCSDGGPVRLDGTEVGSGYRPSSALTVTPDGTRHMLWNSSNALFSTREFSTAAAPLFTNMNELGGEVRLTSDAGGVLHALVRGVEGQDAGWDLGAVVYMTSTDGGQTWTPFEYVDPSDAVPNSVGLNHGISLAVDASGVPAATYWRWTGELWYARRDGPGGTWTHSLVSTNAGARGPRSAEVDFDAAGRPVIAFYDLDANVLRLARPVSQATPPVVTVPPGAIVEATGPAGAMVDFPASAADSNGNPLTTTCAPGSGASFPIAVTTVVCSATDGDGLTSSASFTVTVRDTRPPALSLPGDLTSQATEAGGLVVTFAASATDSVDGVTAIDCVPASGSLFPVATTIVTCSSSDSRGNTASGRFNVTVEPALPACLPPPTGLAAWWPGNGSVTDAVAGRPGIVHGGVSYGPGVNGQALAFDGTTGYVEVPTADDNDLYPGNGSFTLSAWVKTTSMETLTIANKDECLNGCPIGHSAYTLYLFQGIPVAVLRNSEGFDTGNFYPGVAGTRSIADGAFHHVVLVRENFPNAVPGFPDFGVVRLYVDGQIDQLESSQFDGSIEDGNGLSNPLTIGAHASGDQAYAFFDGAIDDLTFHRRALSDAEIRGLFLQRTAGRCHGADNQPPVLDLLADRASIEGDTIVPLAVIAHDPDGDALGYSASGLPWGLSIDIATGLISGTFGTDPYGAPGVGVFAVTITVTDGSLRDAKSFTWTVAPRDTTPPAITVPENRTVEATGPSGTVVSFVATATDLVDGARAVTCAPASGSTFPVGLTTVSCTSPDRKGNSATAAFTVTVRDTTAPSVRTSGDQAVDATGPSGATVVFTATATDLVDGSLTPVCIPASGSTFAVGTTTVTCSATDAHGNRGVAKITVTVRSAEEIIAALLAEVVNADFRQAANLLRNVLDRINSAHVGAACNQLGAFINMVEAKAGKSLTVEEAAGLKDSAKSAKAALGCP